MWETQNMRIGRSPSDSRGQLLCVRWHSSSCWEICSLCIDKLLTVLLQLKMGTGVNQDPGAAGAEHQQVPYLVVCVWAGSRLSRFTWNNLEGFVGFVQDPGWQPVLLGDPQPGVQPAAPVSHGHPQGAAHQPAQELAYPGQSGGVPLLPDLSYWRRKQTNETNNWEVAQLLKLATNTLQNPQTVQPLSLKLYRFSRAI